ncbi:hypothetical protein AU255_10420 [Methyloprofundus sedimenti]|uniref:DUF4124 domain-containing protein n=1 Tax=Methyloprofundus sedimenti TaxID=1420851 RepID=A0A1V8M9E7_9GAMM|nr:hypothetical protein [Methyloprofundus sedimenti]OQK18221.1 hypothetical protein AU255_10420 [Methyloprofundus sedimenti]
MRVILIFLLSVFMNSAAAITRCELNGKVYYQTATCPEHAKAEYLINGKYIDEEQLLKHRQEKKVTMPEDLPAVTEEKPEQAQNSIEPTDAKKEEADEQDKKPVHNPAQVNVPSTFEYVNPKLSDMQKQLDEHNKELQKLQNVQ